MTSNEGTQRRHLLSNPPLQLLDLPDFLHSSPFLPLSHPSSESKPAIPSLPRPTPNQILRSKPIRTAIVLFLALVVLLLLRSRLPIFDPLAPFLGHKCVDLPPVERPVIFDDGNINWSSFAYATYATNVEYLCNAVMIMESLHRLRSKADRIILYSNKFALGDMSSIESRLLRRARDEYAAKLIPIEVQRVNIQYRLWADSYTKLLAFNQTAYSRLLLLDSDSTILNPMDELFFLPSVPVALPLAYWLPKPILTSHIMLITPSSHDFTRIQKAIRNAKQGIYDMEIVNSLFGRKCVRIPHRKYALLTGEFRAHEHKTYLGESEAWDPDEVIQEAKFVHFSDHPFPKPWYGASQEEVEGARPWCVSDSDGSQDCRAREIWMGLYKQFRFRRESVCEV